MFAMRICSAACVLALTMAFSTGANAQLLGDLGLGGVTEVLDPVVDFVEPTVEDVLGNDGVLTDVATVNIDPNNDVDVTLFNGDSPTHLPLGDLGGGVPDLTLNVPQGEVAELPDLDDDDTVVVNNYIYDADGEVVLRDDGTPMINVDPGSNRMIVVPGGNGRTIINGTGSTRNSAATSAIAGSSKLRMLMAVLQNRGWLRFAAGQGVCLPPFAVTQVREMLNRREERQLDGLLSSFANEIATMRSMMANCSSGPRLTAGDINRVIGVGIGSNGTPVLYVL